VSSISIAPLPVHVRPSSGRRGHGRLARWAVGLSAVCGLAIAASVVSIALAYAVGVERAVEDRWVGLLLVTVVLAPGVAGSLLAFVLAIVARARRERWAFLWLPLSVFPAVVLYLVLGEAFRWE
jgi:cytochrome bd-type quinol oxidase subunit 2